MQITDQKYEGRAVIGEIFDVPLIVNTMLPIERITQIGGSVDEDNIYIHVRYKSIDDPFRAGLEYVIVISREKSTYWQDHFCQNIKCPCAGDGRTITSKMLSEARDEVRWERDND